MGEAVAVVICAAGDSKRMGGIKKEYRTLPGSNLTVLGAVVSAFAAVSEISTIIIAVPVDPETGEAAARNALPPEFLSDKTRPAIHFVPGGTTRRASVFNALDFLAAEGNPPGYVLIHDGARPWVSPGLIGRIIDAVKEHGAVIPLLQITETPKELEWGLETGMHIDTSNNAPRSSFPVPQSPLPIIKRHLKRAFVGVAQTPQAFAFPEILAAHKKVALGAMRALQEKAGETEYTDDAEVWAMFCGPVAEGNLGPVEPVCRVVAIPGEPENRKITFPEDLC
jgi:2-C-methyl-D-erythritol 4-phosphate cytidylyltransferase/2-C-methyl-D-erythritol 4-phosphate cytidylyltransferase/2-C-methyl-D-erythritol 2,4-cyclodiphosphate synthase